MWKLFADGISDNLQSEMSDCSKIDRFIVDISTNSDVERERERELSFVNVEIIELSMRAATIT